MLFGIVEYLGRMLNVSRITTVAIKKNTFVFSFFLSLLSSSLNLLLLFTFTFFILSTHDQTQRMCKAMLIKIYFFFFVCVRFCFVSNLSIEWDKYREENTRSTLIVMGTNVEGSLIYICARASVCFSHMRSMLSFFLPIYSLVWYINSSAAWIKN